MLSGQMRGIIALFMYFCGFGVLLFSGVAISRQHRRDHILQTWPAVAATVIHCSPQQRLPSHRGANRIVWLSIYCDITYKVGQTYGTHIQSAGRDSGRVDVAYNSDKMSSSKTISVEMVVDWLNRHPRGSEFSIRYNPANPMQVSLVGSDPVLDVNGVAAALRAVKIFASLAAISALIVWMSGRWNASVERSRVSTMTSAA